MRLNDRWLFVAFAVTGCNAILGNDYPLPDFGDGGSAGAPDATSSTSTAPAGANGDSGASIDATASSADPPADDAAGDAGAAPAPVYNCDGAQVTSCSSCAGHPSLCAATGTCVSECNTDCPGFAIACFRCFGGDQMVVGTCEIADAVGYCMNGEYAPGAPCPCVNGDPSTCPGEFQKCVPNDGGKNSDYGCHSCGEAVTQGGPGNCKNGKQCDFGGNPTDHLTCH